ncbi:bifunctional folylpolyglutamate synthase/dihydrofolate synthase [Kordia zhangzhouensis]|uniref:bifunctional folylpolyglutamate synthase/dihydrofolate synthase n=1 Tax=Kordia zhangzhouensis TaxID=1620405 RepID=UPI00062979DD|nr:folylpolyglutamate synthase/dihydrofolate synthase family protein [Kordia zhangzhouensis]
MSEVEELQWLEQKLASSYQNKGAVQGDLEWSLDKIIAFSKCLKSPEKSFKSIHVGGTNGKGSTSHMIASILQEAGYKVGLFTSPHLKDFRERIRINGKMIEYVQVINFVRTYKSYIHTHRLSFFEFTTGMAFDYFAREKVDVAIIEVGMGGRLDATNIINPEVSIITNIGLEHTKFLGDTLSEIAAEKAGIIKKRTPIVIGEYHPETFPVFVNESKKHEAQLFLAEKTIQKKYKTDLKGVYQLKNYKSAVQAIRLLKHFKIEEKHIENGLMNVMGNTNLLGRWQIINENPKTICDTAHNKEGLSATIKQLQKERYTKLHIVFGVMKDKNVDDFLSFFPKKATYYFCAPKNERALSVNELQKKAAQYNLFGNVHNSVSEAYEQALAKASHEDVIYIGGSTFVVAEIL